MSGWTPPDSPSPNLATALAWMKALEEWDEATHFATCDETLEHRILPKSLMRPVLNKNHYLSYFRGLAEMFAAPAGSSTQNAKVRLFTTCVASVKGESLTGELYENEYMYVLRLISSTTGNPEERKIQSVKEFCDSYASKTFFPAERKRVAEAKAKREAKAREAMGGYSGSSNRRSRQERHDTSPSR
ncbi:hypothetical protein FIBSPDRAFT_817380 [Athelia psychrophila]|uniref:Uncharacterized protein n=1 Tax=Athelia psychrophila TaxID=1759441 RepID=A0A166RNL8_9AGAM|nr:hypothetical protein FIBSPDRAFT_817380 [Fibularhizoctonia sp. CBS 109695]